MTTSRKSLPSAAAMEHELTRQMPLDCRRRYRIAMVELLSANVSSKYFLNAFEAALQFTAVPDDARALIHERLNEYRKQVGA